MFKVVLMEQFGVVLKDRNKLSTASVKSYLSDVRSFLHWVESQNEDLAFEEYFSENIFQKYFDFLYENTTYNSLRKKLNSIRRFVIFLREKGYRVDWFIVDFKTKILKNRFEIKDNIEFVAYETLSEDFKNIKAAPLRDKALIATFIYTGIKVAECINICTEDVILENNPRLIIKESAKREIPLHNDLIEILREYIEVYKPKKYLFLSQKGKYGPSGIYRVINKYSSDDFKINANFIRKSFSNTLSMLGTPTDIVYEILGISKPKYIINSNLTYDEVKEFIDKIDIDLI